MGTVATYGPKRMGKARQLLHWLTPTLGLTRLGNHLAGKNITLIVEKDRLRIEGLPDKPAKHLGSSWHNKALAKRLYQHGVEKIVLDRANKYDLKATFRSIINRSSVESVARKVARFGTDIEVSGFEEQQDGLTAICEAVSQNKMPVSWGTWVEKAEETSLMMKGLGLFAFPIIFIGAFELILPPMAPGIIGGIIGLLTASYVIFPEQKLTGTEITVSIIIGFVASYAPALLSALFLHNMERSNRLLISLSSLLSLSKYNKLTTFYARLVTDKPNKEQDLHALEILEKSCLGNTDTYTPNIFLQLTYASRSYLRELVSGMQKQANVTKLLDEAKQHLPAVEEPLLGKLRRGNPDNLARLASDGPDRLKAEMTRHPDTPRPALVKLAMHPEEKIAIPAYNRIRTNLSPAELAILDHAPIPAIQEGATSPPA